MHPMDVRKEKLGELVQGLARDSRFIGGAVAVCVPVLLYLFAVSDVPLILQAEWHRTVAVSSFPEALDAPDLRDATAIAGGASLKRGLLAVMLSFAPAALLLAALTAVWLRRRSPGGADPLRLFALALFAAPILNQVRITPTFNHLLHALPLVWIAWAAWVDAIRPRRPLGALWMPARTVAAFLAAAIPIFLPVYYNLSFTRGVLPGSIKSRSEFTEPILLDRAGLYETPARAEALERIVRYIRETTGPEDPLFAGPFSPVLNFLADRPPAIRFLEPFYYFDSEPMQRLVIEDLERTKPPLIVLDLFTEVAGRRLETHAPLVFAYLRSRYTSPPPSGAKPGGYALWLRR